VSKSGSPTARPITGTPACRSAIAWSVMAMVLDGRSALTLGLMDVSTASARTTAILALAACFVLPHTLRTQASMEANSFPVRPSLLPKIFARCTIAFSLFNKYYLIMN